MDHQLSCGIGAAMFYCSGRPKLWSNLYASRQGLDDGSQCDKAIPVRGVELHTVIRTQH
jgi:hypothetical protein